ncbi:MAG: hypothetical protein QHH14_14620 [Clostridiales bacterium]|nr:hypothetical protein [Clostridiales bacterium]
MPIALTEHDWEQLTPLFWSEISSSYMISDIFARHKEILVDFLRSFLGIPSQALREDKLQVERERNYPGRGHIDVFVSSTRDFCVLMEVKVHDFASARARQLGEYIKAAVDNRPVDLSKDIYLVYLTQFSPANYTPATPRETPPSIIEFAAAHQLFSREVKNMVHMNWGQFHSFMEAYLSRLTPAEKLIIELQRKWIEGKDKADREKFRKKKGERALSYYLKDIDATSFEYLEFGTRREDKLFIPIRNLSKERRVKLIDLLTAMVESQSINKISLTKNDSAIEAVNGFMDRLKGRKEDQELVLVYEDLFNLANSRQYLQLLGTGKEGFSINAMIKRKSKLSLFTIYTSRHEIEIRLRR